MSQVTGLPDQRGVVAGAMTTTRERADLRRWAAAGRPGAGQSVAARAQQLQALHLVQGVDGDQAGLEERPEVQAAPVGPPPCAVILSMPVLHGVPATRLRVGAVALHRTAKGCEFLLQTLRTQIDHRRPCSAGHSGFAPASPKLHTWVVGDQAHTKSRGK